MTCSALYDPLGERREKTVAGTATDFVLAGGEEIADYYEASATWRITVRGAGGLPLATVIPAAGGGSEEIVYVHHDRKGSTADNKFDRRFVNEVSCAADCAMRTVSQGVRSML